MFDITNPIFHDADKARQHLEAINWPNGPFCPHCGECENVRRLQGKSTRPGLIQCNDCREQFTVTVDSVMEDSHLPLATWAKASLIPHSGFVIRISLQDIQRPQHLRLAQRA